MPSRKGTGKKVAERRRNGTVFIVDEHKGVRGWLGLMIDKLGYQYLLAPNGKEAISRFFAHEDEIILILLDLDMPNISGRAVLQAIRNSGSDVAVLFCSRAEEHIVAKAASCGADGYLLKPFGLGDLKEAIDKVVENRGP